MTDVTKYKYILGQINDKFLSEMMIVEGKEPIHGSDSDCRAYEEMVKGTLWEDVSALVSYYYTYLTDLDQINRMVAAYFEDHGIKIPDRLFEKEGHDFRQLVGLFMRDDQFSPDANMISVLRLLNGKRYGLSTVYKYGKKITFYYPICDSEKEAKEKVEAAKAAYLSGIKEFEVYSVSKNRVVGTFSTEGRTVKEVKRDFIETMNPSLHEDEVGVSYSVNGMNYLIKAVHKITFEK